ncbi:hypothetical protein [Bifidobacterium moukalabense]|uniref:Putative secreted protein n=1 Tax=Bifidobacterium moukalabense DSM 27321 TaxID=1435051 RepID=W4N617_9BIFI|nr:hypothetical protein [Bifidobacterium moukalabense]ETY70472.1 putative secreted protein [Bifidobacterium moukalabense DSM 27321]
MKRAHPTAQAEKRRATIIVTILISALVVTGAAITHSLGMWGAKPATMATSPGTKTTTSQPRARQSSPSQEQTNKQATPSENESPSPKPALHVEAQSYEFDMPEYWRDRVTAHVDGDTVTLLSKAYPDMDHPICNIHVASGENPRSAGDIGSFLIGWLPMTSDQHIEVWAYRYPVIAASPDSDISPQTDAKYADLTDLQSGGTVDYASVKDTLISTDMRDIEGLFPIDTWLTSNLVDVIKVK